MNRYTRFAMATLVAGSFAVISFETTEAGIFRKKGPVRKAAARFREHRENMTSERGRKVLFSRRVETARAPVEPVSAPAPAQVTSKERRRVFALFRRSESRRVTTAPPKPEVKVYEPKADIDHSALAASSKSSNRVVVDISQQKAFLITGSGKIAVESPVSTARTGKYTPRGTFYVTERVPVGKISTIYNVGMPYWMRLNSSVFGMHAGYLPGYPASAGCIRLPSEAAQAIYNHTKSGTTVSIYSSWSGS